MVLVWHTPGQLPVGMVALLWLAWSRCFGMRCHGDPVMSSLDLSRLHTWAMRCWLAAPAYNKHRGQVLKLSTCGNTQAQSS